jgi:hypothetical protein
MVTDVLGMSPVGDEELLSEHKLIFELDRRQTEVLEKLDRLNTQIEMLLAEYARERALSIPAVATRACSLGR